jgi:hypothetical protein
MTEPAVTLADPQALTAKIGAYLDGNAELTGLELYYELERSTSLLTFHTMLRDGARNRAHSGLQQSYGDHNRLLMLGLDRLVAGDHDWYRTRIDPADPVDDAVLVRCFDAVTTFGLSRDTLVALWLAGALHDCGMLCGRGASVDVEDGVVLSRPIIDALCPPDRRDLATFVLHHHDNIKGVFTGEVPVGLVADDLVTLPSDQRAVALAALGFVQVAGAASLGEGRLGSFRVGIFDRCIDGTALDDRSPTTRLARLLGTDPGSLTTGVGALEQFLARGTVHGWPRVTVDLALTERQSLLAELAETWSASDADHLVLASGAGAGVETTLHGTTVLVVDR